MNSDEGCIDTRVYTTLDNRTVIAQDGAAVVLSVEQIMTVIEQLQACYDYCAAWKESITRADRSGDIQP